LFRKPSNNFSPDKFKLFNPIDLVKSTGIWPVEEEREINIKHQQFFQKPEKLLYLKENN